MNDNQFLEGPLLVVGFFLTLMLLGIGVLYIIYRTAKNIEKNVIKRNEYEMEELDNAGVPVLKERPNFVLTSGNLQIPRRDNPDLFLNLEINFTPDSAITEIAIYDHRTKHIDTLYDMAELNEFLDNISEHDPL